MRKDKRTKKSKINLKIIIPIIIVLIVIGIIAIYNVFNRKDDISKTRLVINNRNVTTNLKNDVYIDDKENIYISKDDIKNFFDTYIDYDENEGKITTTSDKKVAVIKKDDENIIINGSTVKLNAVMMEKDGNIYIPFSEVCKNVYNTELEYIKESNIVVIDSLDRELKTADSKKNTKVKSSPKLLSRNIDEVKKGENVVYIGEEKGWIKVRTQRGKVGYIKKVDNIVTIREKMEEEKQVEGKINLVWDYYSETAKAPNREGENIEGVNVVSPSFFSINSDGQIIDNVGENGKKYVEWAHNNNIKVWPMFSNNSKRETTSKILNNAETRGQLIELIVGFVNEYNLDGINLDFENMNQEDKDVYSRLVIELAPRLKDMGKVLSVDVTAPDGDPTWSLCFDRNVLGHVADYLVFMAYDQYGASSPKEGTTAGWNWVSRNLEKFLGSQEEVPAEKLILGIPLYTRLWTEKGDDTPSSKVVNVKDVDNVLPDNLDREWDEELKQHYVEYTENGTTKKMWIEDEDSIKQKIKLSVENNLAGIAFWEKDREYEGFWEMVQEELNK